jgi:hypothetical protein
MIATNRDRGGSYRPVHRSPRSHSVVNLWRLPRQRVFDDVLSKRVTTGWVLSKASLHPLSSRSLTPMEPGGDRYS